MIRCNQNKWVCLIPQGIVEICSHSRVWRFCRKSGGEIKESIKKEGVSQDTPPLLTK